uniref:Uncharacterized protein n=1 Tax=Globodera rostochiensis TaxID=31243 RepID=A0A914HGQ5_GLORO
MSMKNEDQQTKRTEIASNAMEVGGLFPFGDFPPSLCPYERLMRAGLEVMALKGCGRSLLPKPKVAFYIDGSVGEGKEECGRGGRKEGEKRRNQGREMEEAN